MLGIQPINRVTSWPDLTVVEARQIFVKIGDKTIPYSHSLGAYRKRYRMREAGVRDMGRQERPYG